MFVLDSLHVARYDPVILSVEFASATVSIAGDNRWMMAIGLITWGRFYDSSGNKITVPAPPTEPGKPWLWDLLREKAGEIGGVFDVAQFPPWSQALGGSAAGCDGYGVFQRRQLNGTRYGSLESLMAAVAALNAHGCQSYGDLVLHQMMGENGGPGVFHYVGADGKTMNGRGQTTAGWFRGPMPLFRPEDDVPEPATDTPFGRELSYQHCVPAGVTQADAIDYLKWSQARTGAVGFRFDDVKGTYAPAVRAIMNALPNTPFYSEFFDGSEANLNGWATSAPMNGRSAVEDFALHFRIQAACNSFDATQLTNGGAGYWLWNAGLAVGFVDNPDTDTSPGEQVISNKGLAYAYLLTLPQKLALIYGKDYFGGDVWPGAYGLKPLIDNLCWISRTFAFGAYAERYVDRDVYVCSRDGNGGALGWSGGLLTALNFNTLTARTITCGTPFGANCHLHEYTGKHGDIYTDGNGNATFTIPSNAYARGESYLCFSKAGVTGSVARPVRTTTQTYVGAADLDVMPATDAARVLPQRLHCAAGSDVVMRLSARLPAGASLVATLRSPSNAVITTERIGAGAAHVPGRTKVAGWHSISIEGSGLAAAGQAFELAVTYLGVGL